MSERTPVPPLGCPILIGRPQAEGTLKRPPGPGWGREPELLAGEALLPGTMRLCLALCLLCPMLHVAFHTVDGQGWPAFKNDATEFIPRLGGYLEPPPEPESNKTMNRAENGGRPPHHPFEATGTAKQGPQHGFWRWQGAQSPLSRLHRPGRMGLSAGGKGGAGVRISWVE